MSFIIDEKGSWVTDDPKHIFDTGLNDLLVSFLKNQTVFDFGCGDALYLKNLQKVCPEVRGCDGNPYTSKITDNLGFTADLSELQNFGLYDWVISFEVGEHIPEEFENTFIDNLCNHAKKGVILSWAYPGQPGEGHINCKPSDHIIMQMYERGFLIDYFKSDEFRTNSQTWWLQSNLLVFYNINVLK